MASQLSSQPTKKEIVIDLTVNNKAAMDNVIAASKAIEELKNQQKALAKQYKEGAISADEYFKELAKIKTQINDNKNTLKANQKILDENVKAYGKNEKSLNAMRANLKLLRIEYEDMSEAERDSAKGQDLLKKIQDQTAAVKQLEQAQGDFRRSVGEYQSIWDAEIGSLGTVGDLLGKVFGNSGIMGTAAKTITGFAKHLQEVGKSSTEAKAEMSSMNSTMASTDKTIGDTAKTTQEFTQATQQSASAMNEQSQATQEADTVVRGFGAAEREAADAAKAAASATDGVASGVAALADTAKNSAKGVSSLKQAFSVAGQAVKGFALQLKALITNPWAAAIAAIVAVVMKLVDAFKKNDTAMTALQKVMAPFKAIIEVINKAFNALVNTLAKVADGIANFASKLISFIPGMSKFVDQQNDIVEASEKLQDKQRQYAVESAKREGQISELRNKSVESEKYTVAERRKFLEEAIALEKKDVQERKANAEEELRIAESKALAEIGYTRMTAEAWDSLSDEEKDSITQLRVNVENLTAEFNNSTRKMKSQLNNFDKEEKKAQEDRAKAAKEAAKERLKNEQEAARAIEDLLIRTLSDNAAKEEQLAKTTAERQIQGIKERIKTEKNLSTQAKKDLNRQIVLLEADLQLQLGNIRQRYSASNIKKQLEETKQQYEMLLRSLKGDEAKMRIEFQIVDLDTQLIKIQFAEAKNIAHQAVDQINSDINTLTDKELSLKYKVEIETDEEISKMSNIHDQMLALKQKYENEALKADARYENLTLEIDRHAENTKKRIQIEGQSAREAIAQRHKELMIELETGNSLLYETDEVKKTQILAEQSQKRLQLAQEEQKRIKDYTQDEINVLFDSKEEYDNALIEADLKVQAAQQDVINTTKAVQEAFNNQKLKVINDFNEIANAIDKAVGGFQSLFETLAEDNKEYSGFATAMAMTQILVSSAIATAQAIQSAVQAGGFTGPAAPITTAVFVAEMVGIVASGIAQAISVLKRAQSVEPAKPKFASGGYVGRPNHYKTDDKIDAKLSEGEYIIKSEVVKSFGVEFFDLLNGTKKNKLKLPLGFAGGGAVPSMTTINKIDTQMDYTQMKEIFKEVVSEIHPIVSVQEINDMQTRVSVKENIAIQ